jgi:hypothetical protein
MVALIEPRNADGNFVGLPGEISVVVLDGDKKGEAARVSRWDTSAEEAAGKLRDLIGLVARPMATICKSTSVT